LIVRSPAARGCTRQCAPSVPAERPPQGDRGCRAGRLPEAEPVVGAEGDRGIEAEAVGDMGGGDGGAVPGGGGEARCELGDLDLAAADLDLTGRGGLGVAAPAASGAEEGAERERGARREADALAGGVEGEAAQGGEDRV